MRIIFNKINKYFYVLNENPEGVWEVVYRTRSKERAISFLKLAELTKVAVKTIVEIKERN